MRTDQYDRLKQISEKLTDVVLLEADPKNWPPTEGVKGKSGAAYFNATRELHWRKKGATATLNILMRLHALVNIVERSAVTNPPTPDDQPERDMDELIEKSEKEVEGILAGLRRRRDE